MKIGYTWLIAGVSLIAFQSSISAQGVPPETGPGAPSTSGLPGTQGAFTPPPPIRPGQPISVLVFPFGFPAGAAEAAMPAAPAAGGEVPADGAPATEPGSQLTPEQREISNYLTASVKAGLLSSPAYSVASYHPQSALIQRGKKDEILRPADLEALISTTGAPDLEKARNVAYRLGMQTLLLGTIEMTTDPATRKVEITLETQLIDSATGKPIKTAAVGGAADGAEGVPVLAIQERAAQEAAQRMLPALGIQLVLPKGAGGGGGAGDGGADSKKAARAAAKAEREAADKARAAARAAEQQRKKEEEAAKKARKDQGKSRKSDKPEEPKKTSAAVKTERPREIASANRIEKDEVVAQAAPAGAPAATGAPAAAGPAAGGAGTTVTAPGVGTGTVMGVADENGRPVPYGYAINKQESALPRRDRANLRVPPWLGLVGFLTGVSFLLH